MFKIPDMSILQVSINFQSEKNTSENIREDRRSEVDAEKVRDIRAVRDNFVKKYLEILPLFMFIFIILSKIRFKKMNRRDTQDSQKVLFFKKCDFKLF